MDKPGAIFMPPAASTFAHEVDSAYTIINILCVFFFILLMGVMTYFVIRYRRRSEKDLTPNIAHNTPLEVFWTVVPLILVFWIFYIGYKGYMNMRVAPQNSLQVYVTAKRWAWTFDYRNGSMPLPILIAPAGKPVELIMNSQDVLHALFVPDFRVKQDVVPNRYTTLWFQADEPGTHTLYCAEYCGTGHSQMVSSVLVVPTEKFQETLETGGKDVGQMTPVERGKLWYSWFQCNTCHTLDGGISTGPTWKGIFGHPVKFTDGTSAKVDENYIRDSIVDPQAKIVTGFSPVMPTFKGQIKDEQITDIITYMKTLH